MGSCGSLTSDKRRTIAVVALLKPICPRATFDYRLTLNLTVRTYRKLIIVVDDELLLWWCRSHSLATMSRLTARPSGKPQRDATKRQCTSPHQSLRRRAYQNGDIRVQNADALEIRPCCTLIRAYNKYQRAQIWLYFAPLCVETPDSRVSPASPGALVSSPAPRRPPQCAARSRRRPSVSVSPRPSSAQFHPLFALVPAHPHRRRRRRPMATHRPPRYRRRRTPRTAHLWSGTLSLAPRRSTSPSLPR